MSKIMMGLILGLIMGVCGLIMPGSASAFADVQITGNGVNTPVTLTQAQLEGMTQVSTTYSAINTWPTKKWYVGEGVTLANLLTAAGGIKAEAKMIKVYASDGFNISFTVEELINETRYYYPGLKENHEYYGEIPGSTADAVQVYPILALHSANSNNYADMNTSDVPHFLFGQRYVTEQTNDAFVKYVNKIEVTTTTPAVWADPTATPSSGTTILSGTGIALSATYNDADKVYFTTDGSTPSISSDMYNWIAARWWTSRAGDLTTINHTIALTGSVGDTKTIKAIVIGKGRTNSNVATFTYTIGSASPSLTADTSNNTVGQAVDIAFTDNATWRSAITGVTVNGNSIAGQYTVTAGNINIASGVFTNYGDYTIVVTAADYTNASVVQHMNGLTPPTISSYGPKTLAQNAYINFTDNYAWRSHITGITVGSEELGSFGVGYGQITIEGGTMDTAGTYTVTVYSTGYEPTSCQQTWTN